VRACVRVLYNYNGWIIINYALYTRGVIILLQSSV